MIPRSRKQWHPIWMVTRCLCIESVQPVFVVLAAIAFIRMFKYFIEFENGQVRI